MIGLQAAAADAAARRLPTPLLPVPMTAPVAPASDPLFRLEILKLAYAADREPTEVLKAADKYLEWTNG